MTRAQIRLHKIGYRKYQVSFKDPMTSKRIRRQFQHKTAAEIFKAETENRISRGCSPGGILYVGNVLRLFLTTHPNTMMTQRRNSFLSFCERFNHFQIHEVTTAAVKEWFEQLRKENKYTNQTLQCIKILMNPFFKWLVDEKYLVENTLIKVKFKINRSPHESRVIMSEDEIKDMLIKFKEHRLDVYPLIYTLVHTGARKNEIRPLTWNQVDFATNFIQLHKTKNGEDRDIRMSEPLIKLLSQLAQTNEKMFLNRKGLPISMWQVDDAIISLQKKYPNMKRFRCHDLRHSFAYNFLKKGGQMYQLMAILGHKQIGLTVDLYGNFKAQDVGCPSPFDF